MPTPKQGTPTPRPPRAWLAVVALGYAAAGCANFQDVSTIIDLRILGVMAEPPEIYLDPATVDPTDETQVERSTVTALVVDPAGQMRPVSYAALACPREIDTVTAATGRSGVVCAHDAPTTREVLDPPGPRDTTDPGPQHLITFPFAASSRDLAGAFALDPAAAAGFQLPIVIQLELAAGAESIVSTKRVIFSTPIEGHQDQSPNANPRIEKVTVYQARDALANAIDPGELAPTVEGQPPVVTVPLGGQLWFEPGGAVAEPYATRTLTRDNPPQVIITDVAAETLRYAYFTTAGAFAPPETSTVLRPILDQDRAHIESRYSAPSVMPDNPTLTIWIVVRDERGGASWTTRQILLVQP